MSLADFYIVTVPEFAEFVSCAVAGRNADTSTVKSELSDRKLVPRRKAAVGRNSRERKEMVIFQQFVSGGGGAHLSRTEDSLPSLLEQRLQPEASRNSLRGPVEQAASVQ